MSDRSYVEALTSRVVHPHARRGYLYDRECPDCWRIEQEAVRAALTALRERVEGEPNTGGEVPMAPVERILAAIDEAMP